MTWDDHRVMVRALPPLSARQNREITRVTLQVQRRVCK